MKTKYITAAALVGVVALFIFMSERSEVFVRNERQRRKKMSKLFDGLFTKETKVIAAEEPKVKYTPLVLTEDEALKRVKVSVPEEHNLYTDHITTSKLNEAVIHNVSNFGTCMNPPKMSEPEKQKLIQVVQNFTQEELEIVLDTVPLEMCFDRIKKEIDRAKEFESTIKNVIGKMN